MWLQLKASGKYATQQCQGMGEGKYCFLCAQHPVIKKTQNKKPVAFHLDCQKYGNIFNHPTL